MTTTTTPIRSAVRAGVVAALAVTGLALVAAPAASAEEPVTFSSSPVVDTVGALGSDESAVVAAIDELYADRQVQLFVAFVDTFSGVAGDTRWADETAVLNGLGQGDVLLAVAVDSRQYQLSVDDAFELSDDELAALQADDIEPELADGDWAGAAVAAAGGIDERLGGSSSGSGSSSALGGGGVGIVFVVLVLAAAAVLVVVLLRRRRRAGQARQAQAASLDELRTQAGSALVAADDAVRTSEQEVGFAEAQFGADATAAFRGALGDARRLLGEAFALQQRLDDAEPETDEERRAGYARIVELCQQADRGLDEKAEAFDALRDLEKDAPAALARVRERLADAAARIEPAGVVLAALRERYAPSAAQPVDDDIDQAQDRLTFAGESAGSAEEALAAGDSGRAAVLLQAAEQAAGQAAQLLDAVDGRAQALAEAERQIAPQIAAVRADVAQGRALAAQGSAASGPGHPVAQNVDAAVQRTEALLAEVEAGARATPNDPLALLDRLREADTTIDTAVAGFRDAQAQQERDRATLAAEISSARARVAAAEDFVSARRGAVGAEARTRIAEAARSLEYAVQIAPSDPAAAVLSAQRASGLAQQGMDAAQADAQSYAAPSAVGGGLFGGSSGSTGGAFLGGILVDQLLGGGGRGYGGGGYRGGGGFGGGGFGGGGGRRSTGGGFGGGGGRRSSSFGGSGSRGRRGGGGRF